MRKNVKATIKRANAIFLVSASLITTFGGNLIPVSADENKVISQVCDNKYEDLVVREPEVRLGNEETTIKSDNLDKTDSKEVKGNEKKETGKIYDLDAKFTVMTAQKSLKKQAASSSETTRKVTKGDTITVKGYVYNEAGNLWYLTDEGDYIFFHYLESDNEEVPGNYNSNSIYIANDTKTFSSIDESDAKTISKGKTVDAIAKIKNVNGQELYMLTDDSYVKSEDVLVITPYKVKYKLMNDEKAKKAEPYSSSAAKGTIKKGEEVTTKGYIYNQSGNLWFLLDDGSYVFCHGLQAQTKDTKLMADYQSTGFYLDEGEKVLRNAPYGTGDENKKKVLKKGESIRVVSSLYNKDGEQWYVLTDDSYIKADECVNMRQLHILNASFKVKYGEKETRSEAAGAATKLRKVKKDEIVKVVGYVYNGSGNLWYLTDKGDYLFFHGLESTDKGIPGNYDNCHLYLEKNDLTIYNAPTGKEENEAGKLEKGKTVEAIARMVNENGESFYMLDGEKYIKDEGLLKVNAYNGTYKVMCAEKGKRSEPFDASKNAGTVKKGETVKVVGYVYNSSENLWFLLEDGTYMFFHYLQSVSGESSVANCINQRFYVDTETKAVRSTPYDKENENLVKKVKKGDIVTVVSKFKNARGNEWCILDDNTYIYSSDLIQIHDVNETFTVKSEKRMYQTPYSTTSAQVLSEGNKVTAVGYVYNSVGNLWYLLSNGKYTHFSSLVTDSKNVPGKYINETKVIVTGEKALRSEPKDKGNENKTGTVERGEIVHLKGIVKNENGTWWYLTDNNNYIYAEDSDFMDAHVLNETFTAEYDKHMYLTPYATGASQVLSEGTTVRVVGYVYNSVGNLWYVLSNGMFIHFSYLRTDEYNVPGKYINEMMVVNTTEKTLREMPYENSKNCGTVEYGDVLHIVGRVDNKYGNRWYLTDNDFYIYSEGLVDYDEFYEDDYVWPVPSSGRITSGFGKRKAPTKGASENHESIDIGASKGATIVATKSGKVTFAGENKGRGKFIEIDHGNGIKSGYSHCSKLCVSEGEYVSAGEKIAEVGATGIASGNHLDFYISINGKKVDPENYVKY